MCFRGNFLLGGLFGIVGVLGSLFVGILWVFRGFRWVGGFLVGVLVLRFILGLDFRLVLHLGLGFLGVNWIRLRRV